MAANADLHEQVGARVRTLVNGRQITLRLLVPEGSGGNVAPVIAAFEALSDVKIVVSEVPVDELNTVFSLDALSHSRSYDLAVSATFGLPNLVATGAIMPLDQYAERHEPAGYRDTILYRTGDSFDGRVYGFQTDGDAYLMFYHKDMLEDEALRGAYEDLYQTPLQPPLTWEELDRQMAFFHDPQAGRCGGALFRNPGYLGWEWWIRFHAKGIWPFADDMTPQIQSEAGVLALEEMIRATDSLCPKAGQMGLFENWERYARGDVYCNIGWGGTQKYLNRPGSPMRGRMVHGPTPGGMVDGALLITPYFNWGWDYVVSSDCVFAEIAYLFALFASTPEISTLAVRQKDGFFDPFRPEHYEDSQIREVYTKAFLDVHRASLEQAIPDLYLKDQSAYFNVLDTWLTRALAGDVRPEEALERVAHRWQMITLDAGLEDQTRRWRDLKAKYPAAIRRVLRDHTA
ncbi:extracellular solute-binding protein [Roseovarius faecimaris]|uniref:Extracellular solute-binding protein n=2 Tax=Roseovarius faecimaris TaxID=2494550 RepID=A0A6I6IY03_9RHOB|nr:extracellular solute-binding protein [Roseovarius faecimaris]